MWPDARGGTRVVAVQSQDTGRSMIQVGNPFLLLLGEESLAVSRMDRNTPRHRTCPAVRSEECFRNLRMVCVFYGAQYPAVRFARFQDSCPLSFPCGTSPIIMIMVWK